MLANLLEEVDHRVTNDSHIAETLDAAVDAIETAAAAAEATRVTELAENAAADDAEKTRAETAEQQLTDAASAHEAANAASFAARDATIEKVQEDLAAEEAAREKHVNETKADLDSYITSVKETAAADLGAQYGTVTSERKAAVAAVERKLNNTDEKLTAADKAAAVVLGTVNKTLNKQDTALGADLATAVGDSKAADAHLHIVVKNLTGQVADNHEAAANSLDLAITALDAFHTERVDNRTEEHRAQFGNHSWYEGQLYPPLPPPFFLGGEGGVVLSFFFGQHKR